MRTTKSSHGGKHSYSVEETRAFADYMNMVLGDDPSLKGVLPVNPHSDDIFDKVSDGVLLW